MQYKVAYDLGSLCFSLGCLPLLFLTKLPSIYSSYLLLLILTMIVGISIFFRKTFWIILGVLVASFLWSTQHAVSYLQTVEQYIDQNLTMDVVVKTINLLPLTSIDAPQGHYIDFRIQRINDQFINSPLTIALFWKNAPFPSAGELWQVKVKTKAVHSYLNQGSFDSQRFAMANRKILLGTVVEASQLKNTKNFRQQLVDKALPYINLFDYGDMMLALAFGERSRLTSQHKNVMLQTGVAHLMAISGMHIMLVAYLGKKVMRGLQFFLPIRFIYYWLPLSFSLILAICYGWLSGFNPPVIRALLALSLWQILSLKKIFLSSWQIINRIIAILLFIDPFMILAESFWLSCYAVICLIFITHWFPSKSGKYLQQTYLWQLIKLQCLLTLLLLPIQFLIFNGISGSSIMANLIAIPTISFIAFPAVLLMLLMSFFDFFYLAIWFGMIAEKSVSGLFILLTQLSGYWFAIADGFYLLSGIGWLMVIIWQTMLWRSYLLSLIVVILIALSPMIKRQSYSWRVDMLDVGHGLAVVITKGKSAIVYDTGAMWQNSSAAELIILPFLQWHNLTVEGIIISHEHNDHIGGLAILKQYFPNAWLMSSSNRLSNNYICTSGNQLSWQGLQLAVLWPNEVLDDVDQSAMNAQSCVIRISDNRYSILLTGDLERKQEELLVLDKNKILSSTILQTPHHGSNTSSYYPFLAKVNPELSLASVARYNPWKLPSNKALSRYQDLNLSYRLTSISGQISVSFYDKKWLLETMREEIKPRWYHDWFGALPNYR